MRAWLRGYLPRGWPRAVDVELCATELASNAIRHTASADYLFAVTIEYDEPDIRLTVEDLGGSTQPDRRLSAHDDAHGHGLALVQELSDGWGISGDAFGRDIWAVFLMPEHKP